MDTLPSPTSDDCESDYDVISARSLESSVAELDQLSLTPVIELPPSQAAREKFSTTTFTAQDIQQYVYRATSGRNNSGKVVTVYVDGIFDVFNAGHALQLRQAKLSFPSARLVVGVFSDADVHQYHPQLQAPPHVERAELVRHCRWVDRVLEEGEAPWQLNPEFLKLNNIDFVAIDEGSSVDPKIDKTRLRGYDELKRLGKIIPTRRTLGLHVPQPAPSLSASATPITVVKALPRIAREDSDPPSPRLDPL